MRGINRELTHDELQRLAQAAPPDFVWGKPASPDTYQAGPPPSYGTPSGTRMQLHNSAIRNYWDRKYVELDQLLQHAGIGPEDPEFTPIVRYHIDQARAEIDDVYGQFFTEQR